MAKKVYKIPITLDNSYLDSEILLKSPSGAFGFSKPISFRTIAIWMVSFFMLLFLTLKGPILSAGSFLLGLGIYIVWILLTFLLARADGTKRLGIELVGVSMDYFGRSNRYFTVRRTDPISRMRKLSGIFDVDETDGRLKFLDGSIGYVFEIVGTASILMFEDDKRAILDQVGKFYRTLPMDVELIFDTVRESVRTDNQIASLKERYQRYWGSSSGIKALFNEQLRALEYGIGSSFKSTRQYMIIKAGNEDLLDQTIQLIASDIEGNGLMFRYARALPFDEVSHYFSTTFSSHQQSKKGA